MIYESEKILEAYNDLVLGIRERGYRQEQFWI